MLTDLDEVHTFFPNSSLQCICTYMCMCNVYPVLWVLRAMVSVDHRLHRIRGLCTLASLSVPPHPSTVEGFTGLDPWPTQVHSYPVPTKGSYSSLDEVHLLGVPPT